MIVTFEDERVTAVMTVEQAEVIKNIVGNISLFEYNQTYNTNYEDVYSGNILDHIYRPLSDLCKNILELPKVGEHYINHAGNELVVLKVDRLEVQYVFLDSTNVHTAKEPAKWVRALTKKE